MARKMKTYQTSLGFFKQAAAPSMKAALEAWGADCNLFHQGAAKESHDPDVIAASMTKPGVVLKHPVGSSGPLRSMPNCPGISPATAERRRPAARLEAAGRKSTRRRPSTGRRIARPRSRSRRSGRGERAKAPRRDGSTKRARSGGRRLSIGLKPPWISPAGSMTRTLPTSQVGSFRRAVTGQRSAMGKGTIQTRSVGGPADRRAAGETRQVSSCSSLIGSFRSR
jgi:hypothetical protein